MPITPPNHGLRVDLRGKAALVTGAGDGIGRAIALAYAANGASLAVNDLEGRGGSTVEEARQLGAEAEFIPADVSRREEVERLAAAAEERFGRIDILVNNAGVNTPGEQRRPIHEYDECEWRRILSVDLDGVFHGCRVVAPGMAARRAGVIINIASIMGVVPIRLQSAFATAKAAVLHFTRSIALELAPLGIRANAIAPGSILTRGTTALFYNPEKQALAADLLSHIPLGRPGAPEEIASAALFLASDASSYMTGAVMVVDGGWTAGFARDW